MFVSNSLLLIDHIELEWTFDVIPLIPLVIISLGVTYILQPTYGNYVWELQHIVQHLGVKKELATRNW